MLPDMDKVFRSFRKPIYEKYFSVAFLKEFLREFEGTVEQDFYKKVSFGPSESPVVLAYTHLLGNFHMIRAYVARQERSGIEMKLLDVERDFLEKLKRFREFNKEEYERVCEVHTN